VQLEADGSSVFNENLGGYVHKVQSSYVDDVLCCISEGAAGADHVKPVGRACSPCVCKNTPRVPWRPIASAVICTLFPRNSTVVSQFIRLS